MKKYFLIIILVFTILSCTDKPKTYRTIEINPVEIIGGLDVPRGSEIGYLSDFVVSDNQIIVSDSRTYELIYFKKNGQFEARLGRKGGGPFEFQNPRELHLKNNQLIVDDWGNRRFQFFTKTGEFKKIFNYSHIIIGGGIKYQGNTFDNTGNYFIATNAFKSNYLIRKYDSNFNQIVEFGKLEAVELPIVNPDYNKKYIKKREIRPDKKNNILLIFSGDSILYAVHQAIPVIKKFTAAGKLVYNKEIKLKELSQIKEDYFLASDSLNVRNVFPNIMYWYDVISDNKGGLYLLLNETKRMTIFHLSKDGEIFEQLLGPKIQISDIYLSNNELWAYTMETQSFYRFKL